MWKTVDMVGCTKEKWLVNIKFDRLRFNINCAQSCFIIKQLGLCKMVPVFSWMGSRQMPGTLEYIVHPSAAATWPVWMDTF